MPGESTRFSRPAIIGEVLTVVLGVAVVTAFGTAVLASLFFVITINPESASSRMSRTVTTLSSSSCSTTELTVLPPVPTAVRTCHWSALI